MATTIITIATPTIIIIIIIAIFLPLSFMKPIVYFVSKEFKLFERSGSIELLVFVRAKDFRKVLW